MPNYEYPGTNTVKNKWDEKDPIALGYIEGPLFRARWGEIDEGMGPTGQFDADHLKAIHHFLFQDIFEWAGHTRDELVPLSDGTIATQPTMQKEDGKPFLSGAEITSALNQVGHDIRNANLLRGLSQEEFAIRAADIMSSINTIHPFREGNGRAQRTFMRELAKQAGHDLDFSVISAYRMFLASVGSHEGDLSEMQRLFKDAVIPERRTALAQVIDNLEASGRPWDELYIAVAEPGYPVELKFIGISGAQFMGEDEGEGIIIGQSDDLPERPPSHGDKFILNPRGWSKPQAG